MKTGRELFNELLDRSPLSRPVFLPHIRGLLSRVENRSMEILTSDPGLWTNSLLKTTRLFGFDGVVAGFEASVIAQACGCGMSWEADRPVGIMLQGDLTASPGQSPFLELGLEMGRRLFEVSRQNSACVALLPGPYTLADQVFGYWQGEDHMADIKPVMVEITEAFCKISPDILIFSEGKSLPLNDIGASHRRVFNTLRNIAAYYNIPVGLFLQDYQAAHVVNCVKLGLDIYIPGPDSNGFLPLPSKVWDLGKNALGLGLSLPLHDLDASRKIIIEAMALYRNKPDHGIFFTGQGPVTREIAMDNLHILVNEISNL